MSYTMLFQADFGDILRRPKFPFKHVGIHLGNGLILHNSPSKGEHVSDVNEFASGHEIEVIPTPPSMKAKILERVEGVLRHPRGYDAATNNCQHTATRITEGRAYSPAVLTVGLVALIILTITLTRGR